MCRTCLDASLDAAFSNGFSPLGNEDFSDVDVPVNYEIPLLDLEIDTYGQT